jgi:hypothetical protein
MRGVTMGRASDIYAHMGAKRNAFRDLVEKKTWGKENTRKNKAKIGNIIK